ncbi:MAG: hypothetical protein ACTSU5_19465 [Promethearchaeota archaeon]
MGQSPREKGSHARVGWGVAYACFLLYVFLGIYAQRVPSMDVGGDVNSRRDLFTGPALVFMLGFLALDLAWLARTSPANRERVAYMLVVMVLFGSAWTLGEFCANTRWVEVGSLPSDLSRAPPLVEFGAFAWDVVMEFAFVFVPFLIVPSVLGLVPTPGGGGSPSGDGETEPGEPNAGDLPEAGGTAGGP